MRNRTILQLSGVAAIAIMMGFTQSGTAYAGDIGHMGLIRISSNRASHDPSRISYSHRVMELIGHLEKRMDNLQNASTHDQTRGTYWSLHKGRFMPGGPMIPASSSQVNPGGPMIPASGSQVNPGGPMIPASSSQVNPGGPMIPASSSQGTSSGSMMSASSSQVNPGGPMVPASSSQVNPGGPMIPASSSQVNPGGPMVPASRSDATDAAAYKQLAKTASTFMLVLLKNERGGNSTLISTDVSHADSILKSLKAALLTSAGTTGDSRTEQFTAAQLSAVEGATQSLAAMIPDLTSVQHRAH